MSDKNKEKLSRTSVAVLRSFIGQSREIWEKNRAGEEWKNFGGVGE